MSHDERESFCCMLVGGFQANQLVESRICRNANDIDLLSLWFYEVFEDFIRQEVTEKSIRIPMEWDVSVCFLILCHLSHSLVLAAVFCAAMDKSGKLFSLIKMRLAKDKHQSLCSFPYKLIAHGNTHDLLHNAQTSHICETSCRIYSKQVGTRS